MTLNDAIALLNNNNSPFEMWEFQNETEYWNHIMDYPVNKNAKPCKVIALIIFSNNSKKHIELQFNETGGIYYFQEFWFGGSTFEMFDIKEDLASEIVKRIEEIRSGCIAIITVNDIRKKRWIGDACFDLNCDADEFHRTIKKINKPKSSFSKLIKLRRKYEIYDWNKYQCVIK